MNDIINKIPPMLYGDELTSALSVFPEYDKSIRFENPAVRLTALSDIYNLYIPTQMSVEIYNKIYLSLIRSLKKKRTKTATRQQYENFKAIKGREYDGIMGGADSFTIIGTSGIGKSSAISRAVSLIGGNNVIEVYNPYTRIIPCVFVQCPFDSSVKGLLLEILRKVDEVLESDYYSHAIRARATTDMLIGCVSEVALNHIGLLIVDEIQNVAASKNGKNLIGALTQLINNSGISVCMVGTPESVEFFGSAMQMARRSVGLRYGALCYDEYFFDVCSVLWQYQYVKNINGITRGMAEWLYLRSNGLMSVIISLMHDAQEMAIQNHTEEINIDTLNAAYNERLNLLHKHIGQKKVRYQKKTNKSEALYKGGNHFDYTDTGIAETVKKSKENNEDVVRSLKKHFNITEIAI